MSREAIRFVIRDFFDIKGRGQMLLGTLEVGRVRVGDVLFLGGKAERLVVMIRGIRWEQIRFGYLLTSG